MDDPLGTITPELQEVQDTNALTALVILKVAFSTSCTILPAVTTEWIPTAERNLQPN